MCNPFKQAEPTNKLRKHQELVNSPGSLFNVQDIWEREEAKAFVFIKDNDDPFLQKRAMVYGLQFVTPFLCPF